MDQWASLFGHRAPNRRHDARTPKLLARLFGSSEAGAAMEFALVAPVFFALILATLQLVLVFLVQAGLETACEGSARYVTTGQAQANFTGSTNAQGVVTTSQQQFMTYVCTQMPVFMGCGYLFADVTSAADYTTVSVAEPQWTFNPTTGAMTNTFTYSPGTANQIVVVRLYYFWPVISLLGFGITTPFYNTSGAQIASNYDVVLATSVAKTESY